MSQKRNVSIHKTLNQESSSLSLITNDQNAMKTSYFKINEEHFKEASPFHIETDNLSTIILLLDSPEVDIIQNVLNYLNQKIELYQNYGKQLYELKIVEKILNKQFLTNFDVSEKIVELKIASLKLILKIIQLESENEIFSKFEPDVIQSLYEITKTYILKNDENVILEYCTGVMTHLLDESRIKSEFEQDKFLLLRIFNFISFSGNNNTIFYSYEMINKILQSLTNFDHFYEFPFEHATQALLNIEKSLRVQEIALTTIAKIITTINDEEIISKITESNFLSDILQLLANSDKADCHPKILESLKSLMKIEAIAKNFFGDTLLQILFNYDNLDENFILTINVLCELTAYPQAIENLFQFGLVDILFDALDRYFKYCESGICLAISRMYKHPKAYTIIIEKNPIVNILKILADDMRDWNTREIAADTIYDLTSRSLKLAETLIENYFELIIVNLLSRPYGRISPECCLKIIDILNVLYKYEKLRELIMTQNVAMHLLQAVQNYFQSVDVLSYLLNCLSIYICEKNLQNVLLNYLNYPKLLLKCLKSSTIVKSATTVLIMLTGRMKIFADLYIQSGILEKLLTDQQSLSICETWSPAIESILKTNPSIKFCVHGRLDFVDKIASDFYISKRPWNDYRILCQILTDEVSPLYPIIIVNYDHIICSGSTIVRIRSLKETGSGDTFQKNEKNTPKLKRIEPNSGISINYSNEDWSYCRRPSDENLPRYLEMLKSLLESYGLTQNYECKDYVDITRIDQCAKLIAEIVYNEMCGDRPGTQMEICSEAAVTNHLNQIKCYLHCNIIPLGQIRFGGYFERAILFKSLADQINLPCSLKRNVDGKILYCEIPIPKQYKDPYEVKDLPITDLLPTHIIDLMDSPGKLYPINSPQAFKYLNLT